MILDESDVDGDGVDESLEDMELEDFVAVADRSDDGWTSISHRQRRPVLPVSAFLKARFFRERFGHNKISASACIKNIKI